VNDLFKSVNPTERSNKGKSLASLQHRWRGHAWEELTMIAEYQVQKSGLAGITWTTICRGDENKAREIFKRQLDLYSIGRFRLLDAKGQVLEERKAQMRLFAN
jgi:hypothetical protein